MEDNVNFWIKPDEGGEFSLPEINDEIVSTADTWSSDKINTEIDKLSQEIVDQYKATQDTAILGEELANVNNWTLGTGWSGSFASGFTHASGNTEPLIFAPSIKAGGLYQVTFKSNIAMTTSNLFVQVGNSTQFNLYGNKLDDDSISIGVLAVDTSGLVFTPESSFTGTLTEISLKEITGSYEAVQQYFDVNEAVSFEIHVTPRGLENVFIGQASGEMNTTGRSNVGIGTDALANNTSGFWNTAIGTKSLSSNVGGSRNIAIGYQSQRDRVAGQRNIAIGTFTMTQMTDGDWNVAIGSDSMNESTGGDKNVAVGFDTLTNNAGGNNNVAIGASAMRHNTTGKDNVAMGLGALGANTTGGNNLAVGHNALMANTTATANVGVGWAALYRNKTGSNNVAIGSSAGKGTSDMTSVTNNVFIGVDAGVNIANTATRNVVIGYKAGANLSSGGRNIIIGAEIDIDANGNYLLNIGNLLKGSLVYGSSYLEVNGGLRVPKIPTASTGNNDVYYEEWTFTLEDDTTVTKKVLMI